MRRMAGLALGALTALSLSCADGGTSGGASRPMMGLTAPTTGTQLVSVRPEGGATGVATTSRIEIRFSHAMGDRTEHFAVLHEGGVGGPSVATMPAWSVGRTQLSLMPVHPLAPRTHYTIHLGGGMWDANGDLIEIRHGVDLGGFWVSHSMLGDFHRLPDDMMNDGWRHPRNGSFGLGLDFTTE